MTSSQLEPGRRHRRRRRPRRSRGDVRADQAGQARPAPRPGEREEPRRPGVLVARRPVPRRLPRAATQRHQGLPRAGAAGLAGLGRSSTATARTTGRASGPRRTSTSRPARSGATSTTSGCACCRSSAGPSAGTVGRSGTATPCPRFHLTWGTGPEVVRVFAEPVLEAASRGLVDIRYRHQVDELVVEDGAAVGVRGTVLAPADRGPRRRLQPRPRPASSSCAPRPWS